MTNFDYLPDRQNTGSYKWDKYKNTDIIPLWVADMDFVSAPCISEAIIESAQFGVFGYSEATDRCNQTFIDYVHEHHQIKPEARELFWLPGLVCALHAVCRAYTQPGDEVITFTPIYPPFLYAPVNSGAKTVQVPLNENDWRPDMQKLREAITKKTKIILLCNPHNPVGICFSKEELAELAKICLENNIILCSDEVHCDLILDKKQVHHSIATISDEIAQQSITLMAPSKTWNIAGLGCSIAYIPNDSLRRKFIRECRGKIPETNLLGLVAGEAAYRDGEPWRLEVLDYLRENLSRLEDFVQTQQGKITMIKAEATYLAWIDFRKSGLNNPPKYLEAAGVGLSDGKDFGLDGFMRLNFACPKSLLEKALARISDCLKES
ncbi:PatB family C-S lyase [Lentisphaera profundi]|uniref:cysteine-S-conjugate beta-lyase n=1 Tax=Lentisphaera profundi TaxID=1658616 RepID=A0ABY7VQE4_9BACT|nr:PatB family C-S lyase [Lentisphaera profundi]WDE96405.1 PatB family C-S lyase [Lentisphaera profundi]